MLYLVEDIFILQVHSGSLCSRVVFNTVFDNGCVCAILFLVFDFLVGDKWNSSSLIFLDPKGQEHICFPEPP